MLLRTINRTKTKRIIRAARRNTKKGKDRGKDCKRQQEGYVRKRKTPTKINKNGTYKNEHIKTIPPCPKEDITNVIKGQRFAKTMGTTGQSVRVSKSGKWDGWGDIWERVITSDHNRKVRQIWFQWKKY